MDNSKLIASADEIEIQLSKVLDSISKVLISDQKDFSFYWSKKSAAAAAAIYRVFSSDDEVILDPFIGSGSALYGLRLFPNKMKFIGIDVNQLPIELINFNMETLNDATYSNIAIKLDKFIAAHSHIYEYELIKGEQPFTFKKAHINREDGKIEPTLFSFERGRESLTLTSDSGDMFKRAKSIYLERVQACIELNKSLPDRTLDTNSRIAVEIWNEAI
jgi:hypothetical protein